MEWIKMEKLDTLDTLDNYSLLTLHRETEWGLLSFVSSVSSCL